MSPVENIKLRGNADFVSSGDTLRLTSKGVNKLSALAANQAFVDSMFTKTWQAYTSTISGWTSGTALIYYKKLGKTVFVSFNIDATSNSGSASFTLPHAASSSPDPQVASAIRTMNNGTWDAALGLVEVAGGTSLATCSRSAGSWTASGRKVVRGQFWYEATT